MRREADAIRSLQRLFAGILPEPWDVRLSLEAGEDPVRPFALIEQPAPAAWSGSKNLQQLAAAYTAHLYLPEEPAGRQAAMDKALELRERVYRAVKWGSDLRRPTPDRIPLFSYLDRPEVQRVNVRGATSGVWRLDLDGEVTGPIAFDADTEGVQAALDAALPEVTLALRRGDGIWDINFIGALAGVDVSLLELDASALVGAPAPSVRLILTGAAAPWRTDRDFLRVESFAQTTIVDDDTPGLLMVAVDLRCAFARGLPLPFDHMLLQRISATSGTTGG